MVIQEATLCTGQKIKFKELEGRDEELALQSLGSGLDVQGPAGMKRVVHEFIKMMLVEIDGEPVNYQQLSEKSLSDYFKIKALRQLEALYQHLHSPSPEEDASFLLTIKPLSIVK